MSGNRTGEVSVVEQEDIGDDLRQHVGGAHRRERVGHGCIGGDRHEVGAHQSAGAALSIAEQRAHLGLLRRREQRQDRRTSRLIELGDQVGGVVGTHLGEHRGRFRVGFVAEKLNLVLGVQLLEDIGLELGIAVHGRDDLFTLVVRCGFDEVGDLRGVEAAQTPEWHEQPRAGHVADEGLDRRPVDESRILDRDHRGAGRADLAARVSTPATTHLAFS